MTMIVAFVRPMAGLFPLGQMRMTMATAVGMTVPREEGETEDIDDETRDTDVQDEIRLCYFFDIEKSLQRVEKF